MTGFADHFSSVAAAYAAYRPTYPDELFAWLAYQAPARDLAWDCATGNGQAAVGLAAHFNLVIATDASREQIGHARAHPRVTYRVARAESAVLAPGSCDCVTVAQALHWFDIPAFFTHAIRVLKPRGVLAAWTYSGAHLADERLDAVLRRFARETVGPYWPAERRLVDTGYLTLEFPFQEIEPPRYTLVQSPTLEELGGYLRSWSATRRYVEAHGEDPVLALEAELRRTWNDGSRRRLTWPLHLRVGRKPG
jgi:SAM-dependent methyltransferase